MPRTMQLLVRSSACRTRTRTNKSNTGTVTHPKKTSTTCFTFSTSVILTLSYRIWIIWFMLLSFPPKTSCNSRLFFWPALVRVAAVGRQGGASVYVPLCARTYGLAQAYFWWRSPSHTQCWGYLHILSSSILLKQHSFLERVSVQPRSSRGVQRQTTLRTLFQLPLPPASLFPPLTAMQLIISPLTLDNNSGPFPKIN